MVERINIVEKLALAPSHQEYQYLAQETARLVNAFNKELKKTKIPAKVFVGGSFAKRTMMKKKQYDIDIYLRFRTGHFLTEQCARLVQKVSKRLHIPSKRIHGSRDYFQLIQNQNLIFELIPVLNITRPDKAENVTDLSYFHVRYVKKLLTQALAREVVLAKAFCEAQGAYGAESWIQGLSGYALECLIIKYKNFAALVRTLAQTKEKLVIDPNKHYTSPHAALLELNESKIQGPLVLVDPTCKDRNVASALSQETFQKLQRTIQAYLKKPSLSFFIRQEVTKEELEKEAKRRKANLVMLRLQTDRQEGDIAGTKLKKATDFIAQGSTRNYTLAKSVFVYDGKQSALYYLLLTPKKNVLHTGPPLSMKKHAALFKKKNKNIFVKRGRVYAHVLLLPSRTFIKQFLIEHKKQLEAMGCMHAQVE